MNKIVVLILPVVVACGCASLAETRISFDRAPLIVVRVPSEIMITDRDSNGELVEVTPLDDRYLRIVDDVAGAISAAYPDTPVQTIVGNVPPQARQPGALLVHVGLYAHLVDYEDSVELRLTAYLKLWELSESRAIAYDSLIRGRHGASIHWQRYLDDPSVLLDRLGELVRSESAAYLGRVAAAGR